MLMIPEQHEDTIINGLLAAAGQYLNDAHASDVANNPRLGEQFRQQAKDARNLAERIAVGEFEMARF